MMSADDEPQQSSSDLTNFKMPTANVSKNSLINEAFNLNASVDSIQPLMVLPPSSNHFQPIQHSRTPSVEIKPTDLSSIIDNKPKQSPNFFNSTLTTSSSQSQLGAFFDKPITSETKPSIPSITSPQLGPPLTQPSMFTPISSTVTPIPNILPPSSIPPNPILISSPPLPLSSSIPPPLVSNAAPPTTIAPPVSIPPLLSAGGSAGKNPYSAKGALNKKVYDTGVPVVPLNTTPGFIKPPQAEPVEQPSNLFMPAATAITPPTNGIPPMATSNIPSYPPSTPSQSASSYFAPPIHQPNINNEISMVTTSFQQMPPITPEIPAYNSNNSVVTNNVPNNNYGNDTNQNKTVWNWFSSNKIVNTFVEKAKHGVESIVTTVDPQMKEYIHPANRPIYMVSSMSNTKLVHTIRESFSNAGFSKLTINAMDSQNSSQFAPQIVGYACALQSAKEKIDSTLAYVQRNDCVVVAFQDFLVELTTDCWFELAIIMLKDKVNNLDLTIYTEAVPIQNEDISQLQQLTPNDYPLKWSGFAVRLPEKNFNFNPHSSTYTSISYDTPDTILSQTRLSNSLKTLAVMYKNKLISILS